MNRQKDNPEQYQSKYAKVGITVEKNEYRIGVREGVYLAGSNWDPVRGVLPDRQPRMVAYDKNIQRQKEENKQKKAIRSRIGISRGMALLVCAAFLAVMMIFPGSVLLEVEQSKLELSRLNAENEILRNEGEALEAELEEATDDVKIRYAAAQNLGMVPSESAQAVEITVPYVSTQKAWETNTVSTTASSIYTRIYSALDRP